MGAGLGTRRRPPEVRVPLCPIREVNNHVSLVGHYFGSHGADSSQGGHPQLEQQMDEENQAPNRVVEDSIPNEECSIYTPEQCGNFAPASDGGKEDSTSGACGSNHEDIAATDADSKVVPVDAIQPPNGSGGMLASPLASNESGNCDGYAGDLVTAEHTATEQGCSSEEENRGISSLQAGTNEKMSSENANTPYPKQKSDCEDSTQQVPPERPAEFSEPKYPELWKTPVLTNEELQRRIQDARTRREALNQQPAMVRTPSLDPSTLQNCSSTGEEDIAPLGLRSSSRKMKSGLPVTKISRRQTSSVSSRTESGLEDHLEGLGQLTAADLKRQLAELTYEVIDSCGPMRAQSTFAGSFAMA